MVSTAALMGIPFTAGFFSKDEILWRTFSNSQGNIVLYGVGVVVAGMTAFYMFRLIFMTFFGGYRGPSWGVPETAAPMGTGFSGARASARRPGRPVLCGLRGRR